MHSSIESLFEYSILVVEGCPEGKSNISWALGRSPKHSYVSSIDDAQALLDKKDFDLIVVGSTPVGPNLWGTLTQKVGNLPIVAITNKENSNPIPADVLSLNVAFIEEPFEQLQLFKLVQSKLAVSIANKKNTA